MAPYTYVGLYGHGNRLVNGINCDLLAFLRKNFANETDTSSVKTRSGSNCHRFGLRSVASGQWQWWQQHLPHSGQLMAAIKLLSTKHLPHWHLLAESRRNGARTWQLPRGEIGCYSRSEEPGLLHLGSQLQFGYAEAESNHNLKTLFGQHEL